MNSSNTNSNSNKSTIKISGVKPVLWSDTIMQRQSSPATVSVDADTYLDSKADELKDILETGIFANGGTVDIDGTTEDAESLALRFAQRFADEDMNSREDDVLSSVFWKTSLALKENDFPMNLQAGMEALEKAGLPLPKHSGVIVKYTPGDIIQAAKELLADWDSQDARRNLCGNIAGYIGNDITARYMLVKNDRAWNDWKADVTSIKNALVGSLSVDCNSLLSELEVTDLDKIGEGFLLRKPESILDENAEENQEFSFLRIVEKVISSMSPDIGFTAPILINEEFFMSGLMVLNVEVIAYASEKDIKKFFEVNTRGFNQGRKLNIVSNKKLKKAEKVERSLQKNKGRNKTTRSNAAARAAKRKFRGKPASPKELLAMCKKVIDNRTTTKMTSNTYKQNKPTYMRGNRRNPNDPNLMGKIQTVKYRPDIHIYIDTSGSISENMYKDAVYSIIALAKATKVNLYITSFSHIISQTSKLEVEGRSVMDIYRQFQKIDKVTGGTNFELVWDKIRLLDGLNRKNGKSYQINFMITDFAWYVPNRRVMKSWMPEVKNLYYLPMNTSNKSEYRMIVSDAEAFCKDMEKIGDKTIKKRILMP